METRISNVQVSEQTAEWLALMAQCDKFRENLCTSLNRLFGVNEGEERFMSDLYAPMEKICGAIEDCIIKSMMATNEATAEKDYKVI